MARYICIFLLFLMGCGAGTPVTPPQLPPKDHVRVEPGAVDQDAPEEYTTSESGLKYRIRRKSDGKKPVDMNLVRVHYRGTFENGEIFDSSYGKFGGSRGFPLDPNVIIKGWVEGIQLIGEGGMIELIVPPHLGYGEKVVGRIPSNSTLYFVVELIEINSKPQ